MDETCTQLWQKLSAALKPQVSADTFKRWFSAVRLVEVSDDAFTFLVPNNIYQFWIESNHMVALQAAIVAAFGAPRAVKFIMPSDAAATTTETADAIVEDAEPEVAPVSAGSVFCRQNSTGLGTARRRGCHRAFSL